MKNIELQKDEEEKNKLILKKYKKRSIRLAIHMRRSNMFFNITTSKGNTLQQFSCANFKIHNSKKRKPIIRYDISYSFGLALKKAGIRRVYPCFTNKLRGYKRIFRALKRARIKIRFLKKRIKIKKYKPHNGCPKKKKRRKSRGMRLRRRRLKVRLFRKIKKRKFRRNRRSLKKKKLIGMLRFLLKKKNKKKIPAKIPQPIHDFYYKSRNITFFLKLGIFKRKFKYKKQNKSMIKNTKRESLYAHSKNTLLKNNLNELSNLIFLFKKENMVKKKIRLMSEIERKWSKITAQRLLVKIPNYFIKKSYSTKIRAVPDDIFLSLTRRNIFSKKKLSKNKNKKNLTYWTAARLIKKQKNFVKNKIRFKKTKIFKGIPKKLLFLNKRGIIEQIAYRFIYRRAKFMKENIKNMRIKKKRRRRSRYFARKNKKKKISDTIIDYSNKISRKYSTKLILKLEKADIHHNYIKRYKWWRRWNTNFEKFLRKKISLDAKINRREYLAKHNRQRKRFKRINKKKKRVFEEMTKHPEIENKELTRILTKKSIKKKTKKSLHPSIIYGNNKKGKWPSGLKYLP